MRSRADDLPAPRQPEYSEYIYSENWDHVKPYEKESRSVSELALLPAFTAKSQQAKGRLDRAVSKEDYPWVFPDTMIKPSLDKNDLLRIMGNLVHAVNDINPTALALKAYFPACHDMTVLNVVPFSSERKYSGACFAEEGTYLIGASQFLFPSLFPSLQEECIRYTAEGIRVLVLAHSARLMPEHDLPPDLLPVGLVLLSDEIRPEAARTMAFFREQGVDLKVISGDDPVTVAAIAGKAGLTTAQDYCDASTLQTKEELVYAVQEYSVFGRVTPYQKKEMVKALKEQKRTVAMTGDGVNDVLALKAADCSIAMATGSDAAKNISNIVLLDSDFSSIPQVVNQGRRVINNIRTAASMFLIKTIFSVLLSLATIFWGKAYPFEPVQMSLISACAVGVPTFLLSQEFNYEKTDNGFLRYVFLNAFPAAVTITGCILVVQLAGERFYPSGEMLGTACFLVTGWNYMAALRTVYSPLNLYRTIIIYGMELVFFLAAVLFQNILTLRPLEFGMLILVFVLMTFSPLVIKVITDWLHRGYRRSLDEKPKSFLYRMVVFLKSRHIGKQE
ncbi:MAG: HAD-IC family P-type ATPase [Blautia sp.]|nr:HAD-IC family P-type ATPase [Blautia sp.]